MTEPLLVDADGAAERLGIGRRSVERRAATGELPSVRIGASRRFRVADLAAYVDRLGVDDVVVRKAVRVGARTR
jgi:excisionase family DNA binding protein